MKYIKTQLNRNVWVITEEGHDYNKPVKAITFAFDTENLVYFKGALLSQKDLFKKTKNLNTEAKRKYLSSIVWAWQVYDEFNGFFMTNDFETLLTYLCSASLKFGWCFNSSFDFSQIDYEILAKGRDKWNKHERKQHREKGYNKGQPFTYESIHNNMGARYGYKVWFPYRNKDRHCYTHAVEFRDFMKIVSGSLKKVLQDLNVVDNDGVAIRKLEMNYQNVNFNNLTEEEINYCVNDVKGLYFAVKQFNEVIEKQSNGESHIFGKYTNIMTAGGFAKRELLRSLYPDKKDNRRRLQAFQKLHPMTEKVDEYLRLKYLYRGGITFVNPYYQGKMLTGRLMYRYDVNSEYPFAMSQINDLIGSPRKMAYNDFYKMPLEERQKYQVAILLTSVYGTVKSDMVGVWYDVFKKKYTEQINEEGEHLIFEEELIELSQWYNDFEFTADYVIIWRKGGKIYAPFINENYKLKADAKREGNKTVMQAVKLKLNSSYGKLSERIERVNGHYELNDESGAIHFVEDGLEIDIKSVMSVAVGSLITSYARTFILRKIREVCPNVRKDFIYIDTDSIHCFNNYDKADAFALGGLKLEATCQACKYIAPKTYIDILNVNKDNTVNFENIELHTKGVNINAVYDKLKKKQKGKKHGLPTLALIDRLIDYGQKYICLVSMNVQGGKVLLPCEKYIARYELKPNEDKLVYNSDINGSYFSEI